MKFKIIKSHSKNLARVGQIETSHGTIETPAFIVGGTKATVKALTIDQIKNLNSQAILANTYHLMLQPGAEIIQQANGLANFMGYDGPTFTDSGGFQIFSLGLAYKQNLKDMTNSQNSNHKLKFSKGLINVSDDGVEFKSHLDGTKYFMSPEKSMKIQHQIGADIHMAFDQLTTPLADQSTIEEACRRTHEWAARSLAQHQLLNHQHKKNQQPEQSLYGIVQGSRIKNLRIESAKIINSLGFDGFAIGGIFEPTEINQVLGWIMPKLTLDKPKHLLGMGAQPLDLFLGIENGIDTFDCVAPTRQARNGALYTSNGRINITNQQFKTNYDPIDKNCRCYTCLNHTQSYLNHLFKANELLAYTLSSIHNEYFVVNLVNQIRQSILNENYQDFKESFLNNYYYKQLDSIKNFI